MNLGNMFRKTWAAGLLLFTMIFFRGNKTIEPIESSSDEESPEAYGASK